MSLENLEMNKCLKPAWVYLWYAQCSYDVIGSIYYDILLNLFCVNQLFVRHFPSILGGLESRLMEVLKENKQYFKESTLEILVKVRDRLTGEHM